MNSRTPGKQRRSLRDALRDILWRGRRHKPEPTLQTIGSGILRREPSLPNLPTRSALPFIPEVEERFDIVPENYSIPDRFDVSSVATAVSLGHSLKPQMSLSSFKSRHLSTHEVPFLDKPPVERWVSQHPRTAVPTSVPDRLTTGNSWRGSLVDIPSLRPSSSTLRIKRSDQSLRHESPISCLAPRTSRGLLRKKSSVGGIRQHLAPPSRPSHGVDQKSTRSRSTNSTVRFAEPPTTPCAPSVNSDASNSILGVKHFSSFCVLDTVTPGCPVTATSSELRYIFDIGEQFCLNNQGCEGTSMDMVTGEDAVGNPITHLVLFSPLVIPSSGRSRFMLASLIDVTDFLQDTASSDLSTISEESFEDEAPTPPLPPRGSRRMPAMFGSPRLRIELSADSLLSGCSVAEPKSPTEKYDDDIWINLATEERRRTPGLKSSGSQTPTSVTSSVITIDDVLNDFMGNLQELYSDFFLLAKSPLDDNYYEICNVSPTVYASKDYVHGHLSRTSPNDMLELSSQLTLDKPFTMLVKWGTRGQHKQLYCIPLFARVSVTWVCFLVDPSLPPLWS